MSRSWCPTVTRTLVGVLAGATLLLTAAPAAATTSTSTSTTITPTDPRTRMVAEVLPAVAYLEIESSATLRDRVTGRELGPVTTTGTCSGVMVSSDGHVATAGHCVAEEDVENSIRSGLADELAARGIGTRAQMLAFLLVRYDIGGAAPGTPVDRDVTVVRADAAGAETRMPGRIVDALPNDRGDVALVDVEGENFPTAALAPPGDPTPGTPVTAVGYPADRDRLLDPSRRPSWKDGTVSSVQTRDGVPFVEVSADMAPGMSGGPAVDGQGRVIGIHSMGLSRTSGAFNFVTPTSTLRTMLDRHGVSTEPGPVDVAFRRGLDGLASGENADAVADLRETLRLRPDHGQAAALLRTAEEAYARDGDASERRQRFLLVVAASVLGGLVLVGGAVTTIVVRRRRAGVTTTSGAAGGSDPFPATAPIGPLPQGPWPWGGVPAPRPSTSGSWPVPPAGEGGVGSAPAPR